MERVCFFCTFVTSIYAAYFSFDISQHLNTKTPYWFTNEIQQPNDNTCEAIQLNLVARHGSRLPSTSDLSTLSALQGSLDKKGSAITNPLFFWMRNWTSPFESNDAYQLTIIGEEEHYNLSKRFMQRFPSIFSHPYLPNLFPIQSTQVSRTCRSASAFGFGLLEDSGPIGPSKFQPMFTYTESPAYDNTLLFFDTCALYAFEQDTFDYELQSDLYLQANSELLLSKVAARLGLNSTIWRLSMDDIDSFWTACTFDVSVFDTTQRFCQLFDELDVNVLEYAGDLEDYYQRSYPNQLGYEISCTLFNDFMDTIDATVNGNTPVNAKMRFAHAETVIPFATLLGLFHDPDILMWNSTEEQIQNRFFRTSVISPYAANIAFVLYNCSGDFKVELLHNEVVHAFPGCGGETLCPLEVVKEIYSEALSCDFFQMCEMDLTNLECADTKKGWISPLAATLGAIGILLTGSFLSALFFRLYVAKRNIYKPIVD